MYRLDLAAQKAQVVHLVDQVDQNGATAQLFAPRALLKIAIGLVKLRTSHDRDHAAQLA